jgi:ribosomal protein S18 acetylase RimI-like enzyme
MFRCDSIDLNVPSSAFAVHAIYKQAHAQEARLLGHENQPTEEWSSEAFRSSGHFCLGAFDAGHLVGVVCVGPDDKFGQLSIASLFVLPACQRRGAARQLLQNLIARSAGIDLSVSVATSNGPALALYASFGFDAYRRGTLGSTQIPMTKLRRRAA